LKPKPLPKRIPAIIINLKASQKVISRIPNILGIVIFHNHFKIAVDMNIIITHHITAFKKNPPINLDVLNPFSPFNPLRPLKSILHIPPYILK